MEPAANTPRSTDELRALYEDDLAHQRLERVAVAAFFLLQVWLCGSLAVAWSVDPLLLAGIAVAAYVGADFLSGLVHWMGDTWGSVETPVLGRAFIGPFRRHHLDPKSMTLYNWVATNGNNSAVTLIALVPAALVPAHAVPPWVHYALWFVVFLTAGVFFTNLIHRWAHEDDPPRIARVLQRWGLILSPEHHAAHHAAPHDRHYCITAGWLDPLLQRTDFFRRLERLVTTVTGAQPRRDDLELERGDAARPAGR